MPNTLSVENNFIGGLKTEFTGLNFPENACTSVSNCVFSLIGDVLRREGIDFEDNFSLQTINANSVAVNYHKWNNAGGDGSSQIVVVQLGNFIYFFRSNLSTPASPISAQLMTANIDIRGYQVVGNTNNPSVTECQFADGNGFLFVFHPDCEPFYVQFTAQGPAISSSAIQLQIRDFSSYIPEPGSTPINFRPTTLSDEHNYNLQNQGWTSNPQWSTSSTTSNIFTNNSNGGSASLLPLSTPQPATSETFTVASGLTVNLGTLVNITWSIKVVYQASGDGNFTSTLKGTAVGNVTAYSGTSMTINVTSSTTNSLGSGSGGFVSTGSQNFTIAPTNLNNTINTWFTQIGNYPSNADIWFNFISPQNVTTGSPGTFSPSSMVGLVPLSVSQAPNGHFVIGAFNQARTGISGLNSLTDTNTIKRPRTGCWFQGRVWYSGIDDSQLPTGNAPFYTWTENIYFSQIVTTVQDFGFCYQQNDPTDNKLFDLLPDDGGVLVIQGSGPIYKLFPIQNGLLVFAANGVWIIRGNSGLGFTADDYSINKLASVKSISGTSFVDVLGLPFFWNSEGIYRVGPSSEDNAPYGFGGLIVEPLTVGTILSFYNDIPFDSKRFVRGTYDPISYVISWVYRSTQESGISNRYQFDSSLNINIHNRAFYPYALTAGPHNFICGIQYVDYPAGTLNPTIKYLTSVNTPNQFTFSEEMDNINWVDWFSFDNVGIDYPSHFTIGYKISGQGYRKFMPIYAYMYANASVSSSYGLQSIWDFSTTNLGRQSNIEIVTIPKTVTYSSGLVQAPQTGYGFVYNRHKLRGHGQAFQMTVSSVVGEPFHLIGWSIPQHVNVGS